eukprot:jgi/Psemu1/185360/e_gw1.48.53.1
MRPIAGHAARFYLVFFLSLVAVVACFAQPKPSGNSGSGSGEGFGKKTSRKTAKTATATTTTSATPERKYLDPFELELTHSSNTPDVERRVRSLVDRSPGDVLLEIPSEDVLTAERIRSRLEASCAANGDDSDSDSGNSVSNSVSNSDDIFDGEEEALALELIRWKQQGLDRYVSEILPQKHGNAWTLPPDWWKVVEAVLPRCYSETFAATRQRASQFAVSAATARAVSPDEALWAFSMVRSRSLAVPELQTEQDTERMRMPLALIPGLDLLNHRFGSGTTLQLVVDDDGDDDGDGDNDDRSRWVVSSSESITAGDEVFLSYGDDKDNWKLLLTYGFCLPDNPNAVVFWTWEDLLDAAHAVRPDPFSETVCQQLLRHPQLGAYTVRSEDRATFSYDSGTGEPRESLSNGLAMLNSLAAQLGKPEPDPTALSERVLGELVRRRVEELEEGRTLLEEHLAANDKPSEWDGFFESLRVALQTEERQVQSQQKRP